MVLWLLTIVLAIVIISWLVIIHEFGHFWVAKKVGLKVEEFGLGYPPRAKVVGKWRETLFTLNWVPFGGFVRIEGEDDERFFDIGALRRLAVILAGATVNLIFGIFAFMVVYSIAGIPETLTGARIGYISPGSPAAAAQVEIDREITAFKVGEKTIPIKSREDVYAFTPDHRGQLVTMVTTGPCDAQAQTCGSEVKEYQLTLRTPEETPKNDGAMGVGFVEQVFLQYPLHERPIRGAIYGLQHTWEVTMEIFKNLRNIGVQVSRKEVPQDVSGPFGIIYQIGLMQLVSSGGLAILDFAGIISVNLAAMNVLPIPALDGGRAVFVLLSKVVSKKRVMNWEQQANLGGFIFLITMIVLVSIKDLVMIVFAR